MAAGPSLDSFRRRKWPDLLFWAKRKRANDRTPKYQQRWVDSVLQENKENGNADRCGFQPRNGARRMPVLGIC